MVEIVLHKMPHNFSVLTCCYRNWNQLCSCDISQSFDDFVLWHILKDVTGCIFQHDQQFLLKYCDLFHLDYLQCRMFQTGHEK